MATYISTIHVDVQPEVAFAQVFELMMKSVGGSRVGPPDAPPEGIGARFQYESRLLGHGIRGTCTVTEYIADKALTLQWQGPERFAVGDLRGEWAFLPDDDGTTITVRSIFNPRIPVLHALAARLMILGVRRTELPAMKAEMEARSPEAR